MQTTRRPAMVPFLLLLLITTFISTSSEAATSPQDVDSLNSLYKAWMGNPSSWDFSTDPCENQWLGIRCDDSQTRITQIILINQGLAGTLSSAIGNLTNLTDLDLSSNKDLGGPLPAEIGNLSNVQRIFIQQCNLSGSIPPEIGSLTRLKYLGLSQNAFTGGLPATIGLLKSMVWLDVSSNKLSGPLPVSSTNSIGSGLDSLVNALHFHLQNNQFSGNIPPSLFNQSMQLIHLILNNNLLTGNIPSTIENLHHLEILALDFNALNGSIPSSINTIANLTTLQLNNNNLDEQLPDLSNNTNLQMLIAGNNPFEASIIPSWITNMSSLYLLSMDSANLIGSIPATLFGFNSDLSNVTLGSNLLNGTLDLTEANLSSLVLVNLTNNAIGSVKKGNYSKDLLLDGNPYCDSNPTECNATQAPTSLATSNSTTAPSQCTNICPPNHAINNKDPSSCQCAYPISSTCVFYATQVPILSSYLEEIAHNFTVGLSSSEYLVGLSLQDNQAVVDLISSTVVKVSIFPPSSLTEWPSSNATFISYVIQNQDIPFTRIGPMVCNFEGPIYKQEIVVHKLSTGAIVGIVVGAVFCSFVILVLAVYALKLRKRVLRAEKLNKPFAAWIAAGQEDVAAIPKLKGARWFSLDEIRKCTNNFGPSNEIGEGGYGKVYRGFLSSGDGVAIKRARAKSLQGAAEFKNEIELLSRVHHRNLVGLIGFCFEEGEQMLVYEYMPNGTLRDCLSGRTGLRMDWNRRIELALGSARGIAYLHNEANPPIIHCDIKSSNILLDEKLVAKVADFGISKLVLEGTAQTSPVQGTPGYLDPDYFMTNELTSKSDVYSFGVVLLEVVTGRLPIEGTKYIVREVTRSLAKGGMDLVVQELIDPDLECPHKALERLVKIALICVREKPTERFSMSEVVKELEALAQTSSPASLMDIDVGAEHSDLYGPGPLYMQESLELSSFQYSGSFVGMSQPLQPK